MAKQASVSPPSGPAAAAVPASAPRRRRNTTTGKGMRSGPRRAYLYSCAARRSSSTMGGRPSSSAETTDRCISSPSAPTTTGTHLAGTFPQVAPGNAGTGFTTAPDATLHAPVDTHRSSAGLHRGGSSAGL
ncbi:uncharacterized protein [Zea mays]|uniref:uncharacterized protein n=1 Tax=Zea mays TaxID=4577 RepID=UPI000221E651|nr:uncharacterized protein LOC109941865 [Zea mays]|eukprot:XP_020398697.1 uncharacterized protein LOC109941865 [Zea mays]